MQKFGNHYPTTAVKNLLITFDFSKTELPIAYCWSEKPIDNIDSPLIHILYVTRITFLH